MVTCDISSKSEGVIPVKLDSYVYVWYRSDTGVAIYVGKGMGKRWSVHLSRSHSIRLYNTLKEVGGRCDIVLKGVSDRDAMVYEVRLISELGRQDLGTGTLYNRTAGGDGAAGYKHTERECARRSAFFKGKIRAPETVAKMSASRMGIPVSDRAKNLISERGKARYLDPAEKEKTSIATKAARSTPESRAKTSVDSRRRFSDPEERQKISAATKGLPKTAEHIANAAAGVIKKWQDEEYRAKQDAYWSNPENLSSRGKAISQGLNDPVVSQKMREIRREIWSDPEKRKLASQKSKDFWESNPGLLAERGAAIRAGKARRKAALEAAKSA